MDDSFYQAHVHSGPHYVLGRKLHPLCLQDILRFMLVGSPYGRVQDNSGGSFPVTLGELRIAVSICSTPLEEYVRATSNRHLVPVLKNLWWKRQTEKLNLDLEVAKFDAYFNDYFSTPELWETTGESSAIGAPWPLAIAASLMSKTAMARNEVWTMPVGEAIWLNASILEQAGATEIASAEQIEAMYELGLRKRPEPRKRKAVNRA